MRRKLIFQEPPLFCSWAACVSTRYEVADRVFAISVIGKSWGIGRLVSVVGHAVKRPQSLMNSLALSTATYSSPLTWPLPPPPHLTCVRAHACASALSTRVRKSIFRSFVWADTFSFEISPPSLPNLMHPGLGVRPNY